MKEWEENGEGKGKNEKRIEKGKENEEGKGRNKKRMEKGKKSIRR